MANSQLSADYAVIFPELPDSSPLDYLREISSIIGSSQIHSFYSTNGIIKIYLKERIHVEKISESVIVVLGHHLQANDVESSILKLTLSGIDPVVPDSYLEDLLKTYGTISSPITHHKLFEDASFSHIDSGVRYVELKVFKGVIIPTTIQVQYRDILCAVDVKVEKESLLKKSIGVRSSRKFVILNDASTDLDSSTTNDAQTSRDSAYEFISQSAETVKINPRRSVKKIANCGESASAASNTFTQSANGVISSTSENIEDLANNRGIDHPSEQRLSISKAINICDLSLPKSAEIRYNYLNGKQRLKSDKVLNELLSKNFFQTNTASSSSANEQHAFNFGVTRNKRINVSRYPKIKSVKRNQKKSVISELLSIHGTERQVTKKVNSCTVSNICDIQQTNTPNAIVGSRIKKRINDRLNIEKPSSEVGSVPNEVSKTKQTSTNKSVHLQKLSNSSKEKSINKRLKLTPEASSTNNAHCSNGSDIFSFEQDLSNSNLTRRLRPRSKTTTVGLNSAFTHESNKSSDTFIILPDIIDNSENPNSSSIGLKAYDKTPSCVSYASQNLPSCSKTSKTSKHQKSTHVSAEDISNDVFASSSSLAEENYQDSNLKDISKYVNRRVSGQKKTFQSRFKKVENQRPLPVLSRDIPDDVVHSPIQKPKSKTVATYIETSATLEQTPFDTLPQASDSSKCLDWISNSNEKILKDSKKRQVVLKYESQQKLNRAKALEKRKNKKPTSVFTQDVTSNVVPTLSTDKDKPQYAKLNAKSNDKTSSDAECTIQQKRSQYKFKKDETNINHLQQRTKHPPYALTQHIASNEVPSLLLDNQSQHPDLRTSSNSSKSIVLNKKSATNHQLHLKGSSLQRKRETWNSISAAAKDDTCLDALSSLFPKKKRTRNTDLNENSNKEELNGVDKNQSDTLFLDHTTSSPSNPKPEVTSIALNSKPISTEVQPNSSSTEETSEQTVNSGSGKSNDCNKFSAIQCKNQKDMLPSNEKMGESLESSPVMLNATSSDERHNLPSNEESPYTDFNNGSSTKEFDKVQSDTQSINPENLTSTSESAQVITDHDALSISLSKKQSSKVLVKNSDKSNSCDKIPSDNKCKSQQDNSQSNLIEDEMKPELPQNAVSYDRPNLLLNKEVNNVLSSNSSKDLDSISPDIQTVKQPDILQSISKNDKLNQDTNLNSRIGIPLETASCDADTLSNREISLDLNSTSSNNTSKDLHQSVSVTKEKSLRCSAADKMDITSDSAPVYGQNTDDPTFCLTLPNKDVPQCTDELINDKLVDSFKTQLDTQCSSLDKTLPACSLLDITEQIPNPVVAQCMEVSDALPSLFPSNNNPKYIFQKNSSSDCKSTDSDLRHSNPQSENLKPKPIITESIKPPKIGVCLPIPQCPTNSSGYRSLHFNQNIGYKDGINPQKIIKSNNVKDKINMRQDPNVTSGVSKKSKMYVHQCYSNSQSKSSQKKIEYGIRSIFYNSKTNNSGNRSKNKKVVKKRKIKSKAKTGKVSVTSSRNSGQVKGCFSEYEFNSSDSDSKDISYSKWRSQKQTPKKRFRSSSLDDVNGTAFPPSAANNSTNILPYDLSMKSRKLSPTIVSSARYDYNTLIRKKRERLDAICRRVSLINKGNLSNKPLITCEKEKTLGNNSNYILSVPAFPVNKTKDERQESINIHSKSLNVSTSQFIPEVIPNYVLPLSIPRVECNLNSLNLTSTTIIKENKETIHHGSQLFESKDSAQLRSSSNYKSTIKSLQNKDFKKSLSQIHAKKVRKRMKKNTVRYMCLQNDGKKIVLKKVSTPSDCSKSPIDLTKRTSEVASMVKETLSSASNELETNNDANHVGLAAIVQDNLFVSRPTGNMKFNSCVNGFLEQLVNSNPQNTDLVDFHEPHTKNSKSLGLGHKTLVECGVDEDLQLKDCFQLHMEATINETTGNFFPNPQSKNLQSTVEANGSVEDLQPSFGTTCSSSSSNLVFQENTEVLKEVELSHSQMDKPNEKILNDKYVTNESNCRRSKVPDGIIIKLESADQEERVTENIQTIRSKSIAADDNHSNLHLTEAKTSVSNVACVSDNDQDVISSIKITEVYGSVILPTTYCDQTEKVSGSSILIIPGDSNLISNSACEPVCVTDSSNANVMLTSGASETLEITINKLSSGSASINSDSSIQRVPGDVHLIEKCNVKLLENTSCTPELLFVQNRLENETCVEEVAFEQNEIVPEMDKNQNTIVSILAENKMGNILIKCEKDQRNGVNCVAKAPCTVDATSTQEVKELYQQGSSKECGSPTNNGNHQTVSAAVKLESISPEKGHNGQTSTSDSSLKEIPVISNQGLSSKVSLKSTVNVGVAKILRSPGGSVKVKKEKILSLSNAKEIVSSPKKTHTIKVSNSAKKKYTSSSKLTQRSKEKISEKRPSTSSADNERKDLCIASASKERNQVVKDHSGSKLNHLSSVDSVHNREPVNSEGCYMIEKTEKPNTFRIFRQTSISSDNASSTISSPIDQSIGRPLICSEKVKNDAELVKNDDKWGPYLAVPKVKSNVCANHLKKRRTPSKELSPKKKCFNKRLSVENINSNQVSVGNSAYIVPREDIAGSSNQSSSFDANRSSTSGSVQMIETNSSNILQMDGNADKNCDIDHCKNSAYTPSSSTISSAAGISNTQHSKSPCGDSPSDPSMHPSDETAAEVRPKDIYSIYRNISQDCKNSVRSVISFPLSEQRLSKFLQEARGHANPRKLALKALHNNKTPGALKELIVQLYDYFKVCNDRKKQLRVSRLIMLLDNRNK